MQGLVHGRNCELASEALRRSSELLLTAETVSTSAALIARPSKKSFPEGTTDVMSGAYRPMAAVCSAFFELILGEKPRRLILCSTRLGLVNLMFVITVLEEAT